MRPQWMMSAVGASMLFAACAGAQRPTDQLVKAEASVRVADEVGAERVPQARLHAEMAKEQLTHANKLIEDGDNAEAGRVLQRAAADAELAVALTRHADASKGLEQAQGAMPTLGRADATNARNP